VHLDGDPHGPAHVLVRHYCLDYALGRMRVASAVEQVIEDLSRADLAGSSGSLFEV
jgi:hypothetical protein